MHYNLTEIISATVVLFAVIDIFVTLIVTITTFRKIIQ